ncbi:unnamed protein product [Ceratitis capitata]|uniref:(Mediterranean fruit fly) hypothetical protein n=1 Tax=Ceratitis capitata TaxID=7213 RepID=A0A811VD52_CERCA|nr:unnamed protein product [Ceratitis capitata]
MKSVTIVHFSSLSAVLPAELCCACGAGGKSCYRVVCRTRRPRWTRRPERLWWSWRSRGFGGLGGLGGLKGFGGGGFVVVSNHSSAKYGKAMAKKRVTRTDV